MFKKFFWNNMPLTLTAEPIEEGGQWVARSLFVPNGQAMLPIFCFSKIEFSSISY